MGQTQRRTRERGIRKMSLCPSGNRSTNASCRVEVNKVQIATLIELLEFRPIDLMVLLAFNKGNSTIWKHLLQKVGAGVFSSVRAERQITPCNVSLLLIPNLI